MNLNKVFILGNLTRDPELRQTATGQNVATFGVATNRIWSNQSGKQTQTEFHNVVVWGRLAEIAHQYLGKGRLVFVEGRLTTRTWQDQSGQKRNRTEIVGENLQLGPRLQNASQASDFNKTQISRTEEMIAETLPEVQLDDVPQEKIDEEIKVENIPF
ncbi:MAG: single-stranded DNA-binding protein [Candidatus Azambacteria bacterium]|nr:single-stranded DNA-binding protein [Candidatus Azambacteria bacterium]